MGHGEANLFYKNVAKKDYIFSFLCLWISFLNGKVKKVSNFLRVEMGELSNRLTKSAEI